MSTSATHLPAPEPVSFPTASTSSAPLPSTTPKKNHRLGFSDVAKLFVRLRRFSVRAGVTPRSSAPTSSEHVDQVQVASPSPLARNISTDRPALTISSPATSTTRSRIKIRSRRSDSMAPQLVGPYAYTRRVSAPKVFKQTKAGHVSSSSGEPKTHPSLLGAGLQDIMVAPTFDSPEDVQNNNANGGPQVVETWDLYECQGGVNVGLLLRQTRKALVEYVQGLGANALVDEQWQSTICGPKSGVYRVQIRYSAVPKRSRKPDPGRPVALEQAKGVPGLMSITKRNGEY